MYRPPLNNWTDTDAMVAFCNAHPFALLVTNDATESRPVGTHLPVITSRHDDVLTCTLHLAKANTQWNGLEGAQVLLVFTGPHAYISPYGYTQLDVPTWNYIAVHAYGTAHIMKEPTAVKERLQQLVEMHDAAGLWQQLVDANEVEPLLDGIVMMDVVVTEMQGKRKLSQNRNAHDRAYGEAKVLGNESAADIQ